MTQAPDIKVRQQALDRRGSFILEAPAGSGKTALLTARFLSLLSTVKHPRQILAVTFTRKAAAEMASRITQTLAQAQTNTYQPPSDSWDELLWKLAKAALKAHPDWSVLWRSPDAFLIDTFHGFCGQIARNWPLEARTPPAFALLDEIGQERLLDEAVAQYLHAFAEGDAHLDPAETAAFRRRLAEANNNVRAVAEQLSDLLARRDRLGYIIPILRERSAKDKLTRRTEQLAGEYLRKLQDYFRGFPLVWSALQVALAKSETALGKTLPENVPGITLLDVPAWQAAAAVFLTQSGTARKQFKAADFGRNFAKRLAEFIRDLPPEIAEDLHFIRDWPEAGDAVGFEALADFMRLAQGALACFENLLNKRGLDFMELELAALRAFKQVELPGESLIFFHEHLQHILVDEAQDLNDTQQNILSALTEGWEPGDGRSIFLVGDPKQSIFRFRRSEVSLFEELKAHGLPRHGEAALPLKVLHLNANFRSQPHLVAFANHTFARVMATPNKAFDEVEFKESKPALASAEPPAKPGRAEVFLLKPVTISLFYYHRSQAETPLKPAEARAQEARYVADCVAALHESAKEASIAILIPVRTHLTPYIRALEALAIPVRLMEGMPMLDCPEVRHLLNLFKALLRPHDDVTWAAALRAPWCRASAAVLEKLASLAEPARWSCKITGPGRQLHPELARFNTALDKVRPDVGREPYVVSLQRLWEELGGPAAVARRYGAAGSANCWQCLDLLSQCPTGCSEETLSSLQRLLEHAYTPPDPRAAFSPVTIMTIHKAKGLEFDHVFAVGLDHQAGGPAGRRERDAAFLMERLPAHTCPQCYAQHCRRVAAPACSDMRSISGRRSAAGGPLDQAKKAEHEFLAATAGDHRTGTRPLAHVLLSDLGLKRDAAEYKRLFYVAATRARETLTLSGLLPQTDCEKEPRPSAIAWLADLKRQGVFNDLAVEVLENPGPTEQPRVLSAPPKQLPAPVPFDPEPLPYLIQSPSKIEDETATVVRSGADEAGLSSVEASPDARGRGVVIHRIMETLARGEPLPEVAAVAGALATEGIASPGRREKALEVLAECQRAWEFKTFAALREGAAELLPEWALEDLHAQNIIRIGRIDLVLKTAKSVVLVDYKTGQPARSATPSIAGGPERSDAIAWLTAERERYRSQLKAYCEMAAKAFGKEMRLVKGVLFFTGPLHWMEVD